MVVGRIDNAYQGSGPSTYGGRGEEHHGVWCNGGLLMVAMTSFIAGEAASPWWCDANVLGRRSPRRRYRP
jgi:hypothetical protein